MFTFQLPNTHRCLSASEPFWWLREGADDTHIHATLNEMQIIDQNFNVINMPQCFNVMHHACASRLDFMIIQNTVI